MLRIQISAVGAGVLLFSGLLVASASAETTSTEPVGKPLQLLKIIQGPRHPTAKPQPKLAHKAVAKRHIKVAARKKSHTHIATAGRHRPLVTAHAVDSPAVETVAPAANPAAPAEITAFAPPPAPIAAPPTQDPNEVVVAGQTVKVTSPSHVNEIDLAANDAATQTNDAAPLSAAGAPAMREITEPQSKSDYRAAAAVEQAKPSPVGSTSWILQVMAALGGAVTAGSVAWFLIGGTPQRTYG
jgi:hypothetical protein